MIVGGCLCSSLRCRIVLRDYVVLDHQVLLWLVCERLSAVRIKSCCDILGRGVRVRWCVGCH